MAGPLTAPEQVHAKALQAAAKALEIDDGCVEAYAALSLGRAEDWDWAGAEKAARRAFDLNPGYVAAHLYYANQLRYHGRAHESIEEARRALELDPLSALANEGLADAYLSAREYDLAIEQYSKTLELYPTRPAARNSLGWAYVYKGELDRGMKEIQDSYGENPEISPELAYVYALKGENRAAMRILAHLREFSKQTTVAAHHLALVFVGMGDKPHALEWLERAYGEHSQMMAWLKVDPRFDPLRSDARFQDLVRRVGLL
jgi:tetratricopeptide (TPR) repeat protein